MPAFGIVGIDEMLAQDIVKQADRNSHNGQVNVVYIFTGISEMMGAPFQQGKTAHINQIGKRSDCYKTEYQAVIFILEDERTVCLEIKQDAENRGYQIRDKVGVVDVEKSIENKIENPVDKNTNGRVQNRREYKANELWCE